MKGVLFTRRSPPDWGAYCTPILSLRREPELPDHVAIAKETTGPAAADEFSIMLDDEPEDAARQRQALRQQMRGVARQVALDPNDGIDL